MTLTRCSAPFYVQFELTKKCNNKCFFCYNEIGDVAGQELSTEEVKRILREMSDAGVFRVNFNGGEPMARPDLLDICVYARQLGLEVHMNTNATLVTEHLAEGIASLMPSLCVSLLASTPERHDEMAGRLGAFDDALQGMDLLADSGVALEVNVCTTMDNFRDLYAIAEVAAQHGCYAFCSTRYILTSASERHLVMTQGATLELVDILTRIKEEVDGIDDVSLPGPVPLCEMPTSAYDAVAELNVPCQFGYGLCRISATGKMTPCTISPDVVADLRSASFGDAWRAPGWERYMCMEHIPRACVDCREFSRCRAGCIVYDESLIANDMAPATEKWT